MALRDTFAERSARMELDGQRMWVHKRFFKDVAEADAKVSAPPTTG